MKYVIRGNKPLYGDVKISGFKNAAASILPGLILVNGVCRIENVPDIDDVRLTFQIMKKLGAKIRSIATDIVEADSTGISCLSVPYELGCLMRASHLNTVFPAAHGYANLLIWLEIQIFQEPPFPRKASFPKIPAVFTFPFLHIQETI